MNDFKEHLTDAATSLGEGATAVAEDLQSGFRDTWHSVQDQTRRGAQQSVAYARQRPLSTNLVVFGLGLVAGAFLARSIGPCGRS